jgi:hypothetical protein
MGQSPVELEPCASIARVEGRIIVGAIGRCARINRAILSSADTGARQRGAQEEGREQKIFQSHIRGSLETWVQLRRGMGSASSIEL